jgi:OmpA-OmpF porin, OOP family
MSFNIFDAVKGHLTPDLISKASSFLGENESSVTKAVSGILPSVLGGMVSKASSGNSGATEIFNAAKSTHDSGFLGGIGNVFSDGGGMLNKGVDLLKGLFGDKLSGIVGTLASFAGIKTSSASSLFSLAAPLAAGTLGKHAIDSKMDAGGLASLLSSQKSSIMNMLPAGLGGLSSMLGLGNIGGAVSSMTSGAADKVKGAHSYAEDTVRKSGGLGWLTWLLPLLLAGGLVWWFLLGGKSSCNASKTGGTADTTQVTTPTISGPEGTTPTVNTTAPSVKIDSATGVVMYDLGADKEFSLPDGSKFMAAANGFEGQLLNFIQTGTVDTVDKSANWFNMFDVQFITGGNKYAGKAEAMLKNTAAIMKAYPAVKIKLGGYTDNTGKEDANVRISQQRADRVKADLVAMGVKADQIVEAVGYGPKFPACEANDTPECKARNRRVACKVAVK